MTETEHLLPAKPERRGWLWVVASSLASLLALALLVSGYLYVYGGPTESAIANTTAAPPPTTRATTTTLPRPTTTTIPPPPQPAIAVMPELPAGGLSQGDSGPDVLTYEFRMRGLHFDPGPVDGVFDQATRYAVEAVQKLFGGEATGRIDQGVRFALSTFRWPEPRAPKGEYDRVEIDLDRQVILVWKRNAVKLITTTSTGSGEHFCGGSDGCQYAVTPAGRYEFTWHHEGWRNGKLGRLYNPYYFNGGIAIHGYSSVPTHPASHGCARIPMHVAEYFPDLVWKGMPVYVTGTPAPEGGFERSGSSGGGATPPPAVPPTTPPAIPPPTVAPTTVAPTTAAPTTTTAKPTTTTAAPATTTT